MCTRVVSRVIGFHQAREREVESQVGGERYAVVVAHLTRLNERMLTRCDQRVLVILDHVRVVDHETPTIGGALGRVVVHQSILVGSEGAGVYVRKMREVEEVVDHLRGTRRHVDRVDPHLV